jgi:RNA recognition motif-containing protein
MGNRLYVGNLAFHATQETVRAAFEGTGTISEVHLVIDRESGRSRGFAFVTMSSNEEAANAIAAMNGAIVDGRPLRVNEAEERSQRPGGFGDGGSGPKPRGRW